MYFCLLLVVEWLYHPVGTQQGDAGYMRSLEVSVWGLSHFWSLHKAMKRRICFIFKYIGGISSLKHPTAAREPGMNTLNLDVSSGRSKGRWDKPHSNKISGWKGPFWAPSVTAWDWGPYSGRWVGRRRQQRQGSEAAGACKRREMKEAGWGWGMEGSVGKEVRHRMKPGLWRNMGCISAVGIINVTCL